MAHPAQRVHFDQGALMKKLDFFASPVLFAVFLFLSTAFFLFVTGSSGFTPKAPTPPVLGGFGPESPPIPAIFPCSLLRVSCFVIGMRLSPPQGVACLLI